MLNRLAIGPSGYMVEPTSGMFARRSSYLDRWVRVGLAGGKVINVAFPEDEPPEASPNHPVLDRIGAYLDESAPEDFDDVEIGLTVPTTNRRVYETVRSIPYGTSWSVHEVVERTAVLTPEDDGSTIVRNALAGNPVPILVPDHRVRGIGGGVSTDVREALRALEGLER